MSEAAAGLVYLFGDRQPLELRVAIVTSTTISFVFDPLPGACGYRFTREAAPLVPVPSGGVRRAFSITWDPLRDRVTFSRDSAWYEAQALLPGPLDRYP